MTDWGWYEPPGRDPDWWERARRNRRRARLRREVARVGREAYAEICGLPGPDEDEE